MRSKIIFVLAVLMGLITTVLFFNYMKNFDQGKVINENMANILVAKQKILKNQIVTPDMVEITKVPVKGIYPKTLRNISQIQGQFATNDIEKGEPMLSNHLKTEKEESLYVSKKIRAGYRAVSVGANFVQTDSNLIEPNDYVDVISSIIDQQTKKVTTTLILQNVRVLAVGKQMIEPTENGKYPEYSAVTLELTPQNAVTVVHANQEGVINLMLHSRIIPPKSQ